MLFARYRPSPKRFAIASAIAIFLSPLSPLSAQIPSRTLGDEAPPDLSGGGRPDDRSGAAAQAVIFIEPPHNTPDLSGSGRPQTSGGGAASRGEASPSQKPIQLLIPLSNRGLTAQARPTFWFSIPRAIDRDTAIEFVLSDEDGEEIYYTPVEASTIAPGIISITLPPTAPSLDVEREYQWSVAVYREDLEQNQWASGFIERIDPSAEVSEAIAAATSDREKAIIYARNGFWYDALTQLATLKRNGSADPKDWQDLLSSEAVRLEDAIDQPLLECCHPENP